MYKIVENSESRYMEYEIRTKADALKEMRRRAKIAKIYGIRSSISVYKDNELIDNRRTYGTRYAR